jgi:hypothetical protein
MMWYHLYLFFLLLFRKVIQEEVDEDSVDLGFWLKLQDLPTEELNSPDAATPYLHFPGMARLDNLLTADLVLERRAVPDYA